MTSHRISMSFSGVILLFTACTPSSVFDQPLDPEQISKVSGLSGQFSAQPGVFKTVQDRGIQASVNGVSVSPALGLKAWMTMSGNQEKAILLGYVPLREEEVSRVLRGLLNLGLVTTALHNTFLLDTPRVLSLHFQGAGTQEELSAAMSRVSELLSQVDRFSVPPRKTSHTKCEAVSPERLESVLWKGDVQDGVFKLSLGRSTNLGGRTIGESSGVKTWAAFSGCEDALVVNGDVATVEFELPYVIKALLDAKIQVVSIHSHFTEEKPKLMFVHFFGTGKLSEIAKGIKEAFWLKEHFQSQ